MNPGSRESVRSVTFVVEDLAATIREGVPKERRLQGYFHLYEALEATSCVLKPSKVEDLVTTIGRELSMRVQCPLIRSILTRILSILRVRQNSDLQLVLSRAAVRLRVGCQQLIGSSEMRNNVNDLIRKVREVLSNDSSEFSQLNRTGVVVKTSLPSISSNSSQQIDRFLAELLPQLSSGDPSEGLNVLDRMIENRGKDLPTSTRFTAILNPLLQLTIKGSQRAEKILYKLFGSDSINQTILTEISNFFQNSDFSLVAIKISAFIILHANRSFEKPLAEFLNVLLTSLSADSSKRCYLLGLLKTMADRGIAKSIDKHLLEELRGAGIWQMGPEGCFFKESQVIKLIDRSRPESACELFGTSEFIEIPDDERETTAGSNVPCKKKSVKVCKVGNLGKGASSALDDLNKYVYPLEGKDPCRTDAETLERALKVISKMSSCVEISSVDCGRVIRFLSKVIEREIRSILLIEAFSTAEHFLSVFSVESALVENIITLSVKRSGAADKSGDSAALLAGVALGLLTPSRACAVASDAFALVRTPVGKIRMLKVLSGLQKKRNPRLSKLIEKLLQDPSPMVRQAAKEALSESV